jgi:putative ABC transport system ATP-binding protein
MESTAKPIIEVKDIWKTFLTGGTAFSALRGINLSVFPQELLAIMGASGSGKSTFMNMLGCLDRPSKGKYFFNGIDTTDKSNTELAIVRRDYFGFIFQSYNLLARTTAYENVELPLLYYGFKYGRSSRREMVMEALKQVGLAEKVNNKTNELSGGQQQRVAIARAIVNNPKIIFADEPTGNLDTRTSFDIMAIVLGLNEKGTTVVIVTHEPDIADFAKRKVVFKDGQIISDVVNPQPKNAANERLKLPELKEPGGTV